MSSSNVAASPTQSVDCPSILMPALAVVAVLGFFGCHGTGGEWLDFRVQACFWDGREWLIPKDAGWWHRLAYDGPKVLLYFLAVGLLWAACMPGRAPVWMGRRRAIFLLVTMTAGAIGTTTPGSGLNAGDNTVSQNQTNYFRINGGRNRSSEIMIDGAADSARAARAGASVALMMLRQCGNTTRNSLPARGVDSMLSVA